MNWQLDSVAARVLRGFLALVLLVSLLAVQTAAASGFHHHANDNCQCCALCHAGHLPGVHPAAAPTLAPPTIAHREVEPEQDLPGTGCLLRSFTSRAPPA